MELFISLLMIIGLVAVVAVYFYNKIISLKVKVDEGWSDIQVQLKRRHDLIGNLVETVKGYATHEKETLEKVIQARNAAKQVEGQNPATVQASEKQLDVALKGLNINALSEAYPDLKANTSFNQLSAELADTENKIAASRRFYNTTVMNLNTTIQQFPGNLFAGMAGATKREFFELDESEVAAANKAPEVKF
ncbi:MAG: LemA family protein [Candidatus Altimarinota bacterium]